MKWYKPLYFSESLNTELIQRKVIFRLTHNVLQPDIYLIVLAENGKDNFRILSSAHLLQKNYPKDDLLVIGISRGKEEAFSLVERMVTDVYQKTGGVDGLRDYFQKRGGKR